MSPEMEHVEFNKRSFEHFNDWWHWRLIASGLQGSAHALFKQYAPNMRKFERAHFAAIKRLDKTDKAFARWFPHDTASVVILYGFALENIFKAVMIFRDPSLRQGDRLHAQLRTHKLVELAQRAGVRLSAEEVHLLDWLTDALIWRGRHPVPTKSEKMLLGHGLDRPLLSVFQRVLKQLDAIWARADQEFPSRERKRGAVYVEYSNF